MTQDEPRLTVLLASNGSDVSHHAANQFKALLLHRTDSLAVLTVAPLSGIAGRLTHTGEQHRKADMEEAANVAAETLALVTEPYGKAITRVSWGTPADVILAEAAAVEADIIIIGARPPNPIRDFIVRPGGAVVAHSPRPVLIIKKERPPSGHPVVVPFLDPLSFASCLQWLRQLSLPPRTHVILLGLLSRVPSVPGILPSLRHDVQARSKELQQAHRHLIETALHQAEESMAETGFVVSSEILEETLGEAVLSRVEETSAGLVIAGMSRFMPESQATEVLKLADHLPVSVLVTK